MRRFASQSMLIAMSQRFVSIRALHRPCFSWNVFLANIRTDVIMNFVQISNCSFWNTNYSIWALTGLEYELSRTVYSFKWFLLAFVSVCPSFSHACQVVCLQVCSMVNIWYFFVSLRRICDCNAMSLCGVGRSKIHLFMRFIRGTIFLWLWICCGLYVNLIMVWDKR